jgi:uncharacterized membrane protein YtjA (UPF0391 family)
MNRKFPRLQRKNMAENREGESTLPNKIPSAFNYRKPGIALRIPTYGRPASDAVENGTNRKREGDDMLRTALAFLLATLATAIIGFGGVAAVGTGIAQVLCFLFLVLFLMTLVGGVVERA